MKKMKANRWIILFFLLSVMGGCLVHAQGIRVYKTDGTVVTLPYIVVDSLVAYGYSGDTYAGHEYVDLGLPSGVKWATCNIGADSPEEYGDYYAWGETEPKETYTTDNSKWNKVSYSSLRSQGVIDSEGNLTAAYDVATVKWGGKWRMPTWSEQEELLKECTWKWGTRNGKNGHEVIGPNGNSIFLPAAGSRYNSDLNNAGSYGNYWSSSASDYYYYYAYRLYFGSGNHDWYYSNRSYGYSVRPVTE